MVKKISKAKPADFSARNRMSATSSKPKVIDGFTSIQAVRRTRKRSTGPRLRPSRTRLPAVEQRKKQKKSGLEPTARIGQTALPDKHEIVCYECDYAFILQGRLHDTICPKCRKSLQMTHHTIDRECSKTIKTIGSIELTPEGILKGAELIAKDVVLSGDAKEGRIRVWGLLTLCPGAKFDMSTISMKDLMIKSGGKFTVRRKMLCRNLDVSGSINAKIYTDGVVTIRTGGFLRGEIHGLHLIVEEGAGLKAKVFVGR